ncbi:bifunctional 2-polyprenyl-6-hydroxyphenol methylase/3-demethylubiquinol 3-O-methyltransferase UbiG [Pelagibacteraceae bacterium]|jgi:2-polyprenyl-6-hydroxyphenyl methylase/3-demethylubiquinone-9 3-methyltransferase|nr:bifunctional 2-polyprenyl-6-hydroxyphenol methylase/3-demethylubiquinol 3-O-methyltransferase UbiG [Pelagibacteraceae bacterium]
MTTINKEEIQKFSNLADEWWDVKGKFKPLHMFNPIRIEYILDEISKHFKINSKESCLNNFEVLDIGCGGGLMSEPMARLGANVTGIDAAIKNIQVASLHSKKNNLKINYLNKSPEQLNEKEKFDIILNLEVVEHVDNLDLYLESCYKLLKKNGLMFTATINRTLISYIKAIVGAEYILRWLPIGTHDWNKFIKPEELEKKLTDKKFSTNNIKGLEFNPINNKWKKTDNYSVNYIICSFKS